MLGGADNTNGELPSYITGANSTVVQNNSAHQKRMLLRGKMLWDQNLAN